MVASYDLRPGNEEGLFWFLRFINLSLTYLLKTLTHLLTARETNTEVCQVQRFVIQPYFILVAVESLGPLADDAHRFITEIGRRMTFSTGDPRETAFLYQRISVAIQRYNAVCLTNTFIYDLP